MEWNGSQLTLYYRFSYLNLDSLTELNLSPKVGSGYFGMMVYNNTKLCNVLFAKELSERWLKDDIQVFSVHPGNMIYSDLPRYWWLYRFFFALVRPFTKSLVSYHHFNYHNLSTAYLIWVNVVHFPPH